MKRFGLGCLGAGTALVCIAMAGAVPAQDISPPGRPTAQELQEIGSTYIVRFNSSVDPSEVDGRANAIAARFNGQIKYTYKKVLQGFSIRMSEQGLANLIRTSGLGIASVSRDVPVSAYAPPPGKGPGSGGGDGGSASCGEELGWNIGRITTLEQPKTKSGGVTDCSIHESSTSTTPAADFSLSGLRVCVIDTGVDAAHEDLNVNVEDIQMNFSNDKGGTEDLNGHGSHVAGIIGAYANGLGVGVVGVAPGTPITPIKVLNRRGSGSFAGVIAGVEYAATGPDDVTPCDIANMSLGGETTSHALDDAVKGARDAGVIFTLAAGNSLEDISTHTPARASDSDSDNIFTIASFGQESDGSGGSVDVWSYFSNYDDPTKEGVVDFVLPGGAIKSTWKDGGYNTISGTSMAAPHMAGLLVRRIVQGGAFTDNPIAGEYPQVLNSKFDDGGSVQRIESELYTVASDDDDASTPPTTAPPTP